MPLQGRADIVINITHTHTHLRTHAHARTHTHQTITHTAGTEHTPAFIRHRSCCVTTPLQRPRAVRACTARGSRSGGRRGYGAAATSAPSARSSAASAAASGSAASACSRPACVAAASWPSVPDSVVKPLRAGALGPGRERLACPDTSQRGSSTPGWAKFALAQERQKWKAHHPHHSCLFNQIKDQGQRVCARFVRACSLERLSRNAFSFHAVQQRQPVLQHVMQDKMKPSNTSVITVRCGLPGFQCSSSGVPAQVPRVRWHFCNGQKGALRRALQQRLDGDRRSSARLRTRRIALTACDWAAGLRWPAPKLNPRPVAAAIHDSHCMVISCSFAARACKRCQTYGWHRWQDQARPRRRIAHGHVDQRGRLRPARQRSGHRQQQRPVRVQRLAVRARQRLRARGRRGRQAAAGLIGVRAGTRAQQGSYAVIHSSESLLVLQQSDAGSCRLQVHQRSAPERQAS